MIFADKLIRLRKKNGWSQEELAEKMNVSRQAVSKWESAQSIPDLTKILQLSELFCVTTDYLLKDEIEEEEVAAEVSESTVRRVTLEEANTYLAFRKKASFRIAFATALCILSPLTLIVLGALSEFSASGISETMAGVVGLFALFGFVLCAVPMYLHCGFSNAPYQFLDEGLEFELGIGVRGMLKERKKVFAATYVTSNVIATCLCIVSPVPLIATAFSKNDLLSVAMLGVMFVLVAIAVFLYISVGVRQASMEKLLREGEYLPREKKKGHLSSAVESAYWGMIVALYLTVSFLTGAWHLTWLMFVLGGAFEPLLAYLCRRFAKDDEREPKK